MKRTIASSLTILAISLLLVGCSSSKNDKAKDTSNKDAKSEKIASSKKAASVAKAKESSKKKAESESKAKASSIARAQSESKAKVSSEALAQSQSQAEIASQASSQQAQTNQQSQASSNVQQQNQGPDFNLSLTGFINKYGMSPAAYRMTVMGMSEKDALYATPDDQQSSGEIQLEGMYRNGQDPNANSY